MKNSGLNIFSGQHLKRHPYKTALWVHCGLLLLGCALNYGCGPVASAYFTFPYNVCLGLGFILGCTALFFMCRKKTWLLWISGVPFAIISSVILAFLAIGLGSIRVPEDSIWGKWGLHHITATWYFAFAFWAVLVNLWLAILKRASVFNGKNVIFLLNHLGLFLALWGGVLGQGDLKRLTMTLYQDQPQWRAVTESGETVALPIALELKKFTMDVYPSKILLVDVQGKPLGTPGAEFIMAKTGAEQRISDWHIYVHRYEPKAVLVRENTYEKSPMWGATNAALVTATHLKTGQKTTRWIAAGNFQFPPQSLALDEAHILLMAPPEPKKFASQVRVYQKGQTQITTEQIQVNQPLTIAQWNIYQMSYDEFMGPWSSLSVVEWISDPWLPLVYAGIFLLMAGTVAFLINNRRYDRF